MAKKKQTTSETLAQYGEIDITFQVSKQGDVTVLHGTYEGDVKYGALPYKVRKLISEVLADGLAK